MKIQTVVVPILYYVSFCVLLPLTLILINHHFRIPGLSNIYLFYFGIATACAGLILYVYCWHLFLRIGKGTPIPSKYARKIITSGPYQCSRNPIYLSHTLITASYFFIFQDLLLLLCPLIYFLYIHFYVVNFEEPQLKKRFGKEYLEYKNKVPRWI